MPRKRSAALAEFAAELYRDSGSCHAVAKMLDVSATTVYRMLVDAGVEIPKRGAPELNARKLKFTGDVAQKVAAAYQSGESMREIMRNFNCSQVAIYSAVERMGIPRRPRGQQPKRLSDKIRSEIVGLYTDERWTQGQIARRVNCNQSAVRAVLLRAGVLRQTSHAVGPRHGSWKGGRVMLPTGYIGVKVAPNHRFHGMASSSGYIPEHRLKVAEFLGRPLTPQETVHHKDGDRENNSLDNLQLRQGKHGKGVHMRCRACGSVDIAAEEI